jgi:hypothetical protein
MTQPPIAIFCSYAHEDDEWRDRLSKQFSSLLRRSKPCNVSLLILGEGQSF